MQPVSIFLLRLNYCAVSTDSSCFQWHTSLCCHTTGNWWPRVTVGHVANGTFRCSSHSIVISLLSALLPPLATCCSSEYSTLYTHVCQYVTDLSRWWKSSHAKQNQHSFLFYWCVNKVKQQIIDKIPQRLSARHQTLENLITLYWEMACVIAMPVYWLWHKYKSVLYSFSLSFFRL